MTTIAPNNAGLYWSKNWLVDASTADTVFEGAYLKTVVTGATTITLNVDVSKLIGLFASTEYWPVLKWRVGRMSEWESEQFTAATTTVAIATGLTAATSYPIEIVVSGMYFANNKFDSAAATWNAVRITSIELDAGSVELPDNLGSSHWFVVGDSVTNGLANTGPTLRPIYSDVTLAWPWLTAAAFGAELTLAAHGSRLMTPTVALASGYPCYLGSEDVLWDGVTVDLAQFDTIISMFITSSTSTAAEVAECLANLRAGNASARIIQFVPTRLASSAPSYQALQAGVQLRRAAGDDNVFFKTAPEMILDGQDVSGGSTTSRFYSDTIHPNAEGHARIAAWTSKDIAEIMTPVRANIVQVNGEDADLLDSGDLVTDDNPIAAKLLTAGAVSSDTLTAIATAVTAGTGLYAVTVTVKDASEDAIEGARVSIVGTTRVLDTGSNGQVTFNLDAGSYSIRVAAPSGYADPSDTAVTVDGAESVAITLTSTGSITPPDNPLLSTLVIKCVTAAGAVDAGVTIEARLVKIPSGTTGIAYLGTKQTATSGEDGTAQLTVVRLATYQVRRGTSEQWTQVTIADSPTTTITSFVGAP